MVVVQYNAVSRGLCDDLGTDCVVPWSLLVFVVNANGEHNFVVCPLALLLAGGARVGRRRKYILEVGGVFPCETVQPGNCFVSFVRASGRGEAA